jgi:hypothetical protein
MYSEELSDGSGDISSLIDGDISSLNDAHKMTGFGG